MIGGVARTLRLSRSYFKKGYEVQGGINAEPFPERVSDDSRSPALGISWVDFPAHALQLRCKERDKCFSRYSADTDNVRTQFSSQSADRSIRLTVSSIFEPGNWRT